jgi:hypothetical protein
MRQSVKRFLFIVPLAAGAALLYPRPLARAPVVPAPKVARAPASVARHPAANPAPAPSAPKSVSRFREKLAQTASCLDRDCDYPHNDDHSYQYAVGQALAAQLAQLRAWAAKNDVHDDSVTVLAITYMKVGDGYVQEEALRILSQQPTSADALQAILNEVIGGYDSRLIAPGLAELHRYQAENDRIKIGSALADSMISGAPFVAKEISARIGPFVCDATLATFREAAAAIPAVSVVRVNLEAAIRAGTK